MPIIVRRLSPRRELHGAFKSSLLVSIITTVLIHTYSKHVCDNTLYECIESEAGRQR